MAATRQASNQRPQQQPSGGQLAALAALLMAGSSQATIVGALLLLLPVSLRTSSGAEDAAQTAARLVLGVEVPKPRLELLTDAYEREEALYKAFYALNATRRLAEAKKAGAESQALATEERYLAMHVAQTKQRSAAYRQLDAAASCYGPVLGWRHGHPKEPRPSHERADGMNFRADRIPASTGALPGVLPGCTCTAIAPFPGGRMLA